MKKIVSLCLIFALLCTGCAKSEPTGDEISSELLISQTSVTSEESNYIEVTAGDFIFCVPEGSTLDDSSSDGLINMSYTISCDRGEYHLNIVSTDKDSGQPLHNETVDFMSNYNEKMAQWSEMLSDTSEDNFQNTEIQYIEINSIGGQKVSLGDAWFTDSTEYKRMDISCFIGDYYYQLSYSATAEMYDPAVWNDFLNNIRPL